MPNNEGKTRRVRATVRLAKAKEISMNTDTPVRARAIIDSTTDTTVHILIENIIIGKIERLNWKVGMDMENIDWLVH